MLLVIGLIVAVIVFIIIIALLIYFLTKKKPEATKEQTKGDQPKGEQPKGEQPKGPFYDQGVTIEVYEVANEKGNFGPLKETIKYNGDIWFGDMSSGAKFFGKYDDKFGFKIKGFIKIPAGKHTFKVGHDDGARMTIDKQTSDKWVLTGYVEDVVVETNNDVEKMTPFEIQFYEWGGNAALTLKMDDKRVPASMLYHEVTISSSESTKVTFSKYDKIGCYSDSEMRAIPDATEFGYDNRNYKDKKDPIKQCAEFAKAKGYQGFAIQDSGWCATGPEAHLSYMKYGRSTNCGTDGEGGGWANDVYFWK
jgi:hypothetical protein